MTAAKKKYPRSIKSIRDDSARGRRKHKGERPVTLDISRMGLGEKKLLLLNAELAEKHPRPQTRGDCKGGARPCPYVGCRYNLYLDVKEKTGNITLRFPDIGPEDMKTSCVLDVADAGGVTLEEVGATINVTRERVRQLEVKALLQLEKHPSLRIK